MSVKGSEISNAAISESIINWHKQHGRHDLPWQHDVTPYRVWVSEIMLQQTQVVTVIPYFNRFIAAFPEVQMLAQAGIDHVLSHWAGLGYYARGRNLHRAAQMVCEDYGGVIPADKEKLMALPGIGLSTAGAVMALAFKQRHAILDGNVKRVLSRFYAIDGWPGSTDVQKQLWRVAEELTPKNDVGLYTQAMMDLGAIVCTRTQPKCGECPLTHECVARETNAQHQYPTLKPKKAVPLRKSIFLLLENKAGEILLHKRPPTGIWGGLWCFPECSPDDDIEAWLLAETGFSAAIAKKLSVIKHSLTHYRMEILPIHLKVKQCNNVRATDEQQWCLSGDALKLGVPVPVRNLLQNITE